jgi:hypothetical protein
MSAQKNRDLDLEFGNELGVLLHHSNRFFHHLLHNLGSRFDVLDHGGTLTLRTHKGQIKNGDSLTHSRQDRQNKSEKSHTMRRGRDSDMSLRSSGVTSRPLDFKNEEEER